MASQKYDPPAGGPPPPTYEASSTVPSPAPAHVQHDNAYNQTPNGGMPQHGGYGQQFPPQGGPQGQWGPPQGGPGGYYAPGPQMGYAPQQGQGPYQGQPNPYGPQGGYPPQGYAQGGYVQGYGPQGQHLDQRRNGSPGFMEAMLASLACCCCLDCLLF